ncbi:MAG: PAS domain S-box protein [Candidatus Neomarinimicrobiota bacterium]
MNSLVNNLLANGDDDPGKPAWYRRPVMLISSLAFSILVVEAVIMLLLRTLPRLSHYAIALGDGLVLMTVLAPVLYLLVFKPMVRLVSRTEQAERESEQQLRALHLNSLEGIFRADRRGNLLYANPALARILGFENVSNLLQVNVGQLYFDQRERNRLIRAYTRHGRIEELELRLLRTDGKLIFVRVTATITGGTQEPIIEGFVTDISKRKAAEETACRAQEELQNADKYSQLLIDSSFDIIIACDNQQLITQFNPAAEQAFGYTRAEALGQPMDMLYAEPYDGAEILRTIVRQGGTVVEVSNRRKNGERFPSILSASMIRSDKGEHVGIMGISRDITEQKQAAEALAAEREQLVTTLSSLDEGVITTDAGGRIVLLNPTAVKLLGIPEEEALGQRLCSAYRHENVNESTLEAEYKKVLGGGVAGGKNQQTVLLTGKGERLPVSESIVALRGVANQVAGLVAVFRDVNDAIRLQAEQARAEKLESISVLAGSLAHDFNNFLANFSLNISLAMLQSGEDPTLREILENSEASIQMAKGITKQLAALSRGSRPSKVKQDIRPLLRESVTFAVSGKPVEPIFELADDLWHSEFDGGQLNQLIYNLSINAAKAMPDGGRLTVSATNATLTESDRRNPLAPGNYIQVSFQDEGSGIAPGIREKIFDPYFTTSRKGNGLGLYSCHMIMEMHSGWITVDSEVAKGSRFTFYLPVDTPSLASSAGSEPQASCNGRLLLLASDDHTENSTTVVLEELGYQAVTAKDGPTALVHFKERQNNGKPFDAVILDMDGSNQAASLETLGKIRQHEPQIPAIAAFGPDKTLAQGYLRDHQIQAEINKPFRHDEVSRSVARVLGKEH